jgi:hypothetical protein
MAAAVEQAGPDDFGDIPFAEPLDVLVESLEREAGLTDERQQAAEATLVGLLVKRLRLVDDRRRHPGIANEKITAPLFIVGLPRTGSTHLHALMGRAEGIRTPLFWEMSLPSPPPERETFTTDPRIGQIQAVVDQMPAEMLKRHPIAATRPEQCNMLNDWSFLHQALLAYYAIPTYRDWLLDADYSPAFEAHRRTLQHLQWRNPGQWVLKYPKHLIALDVLLETYPDARLVWTHRDPAVVLPSAVSFTGYIRATNTPAFDPVRFGREWAVLEELVLRRGLSVRDRLPDAADRIYDLHYGDLMRDPVGTLESIFGHFGMPFTDESRRGVQRWVDQHPKTAHGVHTYRAEDFGLDRDRLRARFDFYVERFGVEAEATS